MSGPRDPYTLFPDLDPEDAAKQMHDGLEDETPDGSGNVPDAWGQEDASDPESDDYDPKI